VTSTALPELVRELEAALTDGTVVTDGLEDRPQWRHRSDEAGERVEYG